MFSYKSWLPRRGLMSRVPRFRHKGKRQKVRAEQFGKLLTTYAGWGMRIEFVPEDKLHRRPVHEVREPKPENEDGDCD